MVDIVERLRDGCECKFTDADCLAQDACRECMEAADEIERLREALHTIGYGPPHEGEPLELLNQFVDLARSALQQKDTE